MSLLSSFTRSSRLQSAIKTVAQARKSEGGKAEQLFLKAYAEFADVIGGDLVLAQALYNWGFALLQEAKTKTGDVAVKLYEEAIAKFSFCSTVDPNFLGAAADGGVAYMELARLKAVKTDDLLYQSAKAHFERAEKIHKGTAVYNLACIYALTGNDDACLQALSDAVKHGCLPSEQDVLNDPDLDKVKSKGWFLDFMASLATVTDNKEESIETPAEAETAVAEQAEQSEAMPEQVAEPVVSEAAVTETPSESEHAEQESAASEEIEIKSEHYKR